MTVSLHSPSVSLKYLTAHAENTDAMYQKILQQPLSFGEEIGGHARSILTGLLTRDPSRRLGVNGADEIKRHPFFAKNIDFDKLVHKQIQPPFKPSVASPVVRVSSFFLSLFACVVGDVLLTCFGCGIRMCPTSTRYSQPRRPWTVSSKARSSLRPSRRSSLVSTRVLNA